MPFIALAGSVMPSVAGIVTARVSCVELVCDSSRNSGRTHPRTSNHCQGYFEILDGTLAGTDSDMDSKTPLDSDLGSGSPVDPDMYLETDMDTGLVSGSPMDPDIDLGLDLDSRSPMDPDMGTSSGSGAALSSAIG